MTQRRRQNDPIIDQLAKDVAEIKKLMIGNGDVGVCEVQRDQEKRLLRLEQRPFVLKDWIIFAMILISTAVAFFK